MPLAVVVASVCKDPSSAECDVSHYHTTSVQFQSSMRIFSKGSHPVSFRSFSCRLRYIVHDDDGLRVLLRASVRGIIILSTKSYDAYVFAREV